MFGISQRDGTELTTMQLGSDTRSAVTHGTNFGGELSVS